MKPRLALPIAVVLSLYLAHLGQKPPPLPSDRSRFLTRKETQDLAARLQAVSQ